MKFMNSKLTDYDIYLFDFDGTLVDSIESLYHVFISSFKAVGVTISEKDCLELTRIPLVEGYIKHKGSADLADVFEKKIHETLDDVETIRKTKLFPDVLEVINFLKKEGKTLGVVTSNKKEHVFDVLKFLNISKDIFDVYIGNYECKKQKPNPDPILTAIELLNVDKNITNICYIGDSLNDAKSANGANVDAILIDRDNIYVDDESYIKIKTLKELIL